MLRYIILSIILWNISVTAATPPKVVVTIKPIHALVSGVMEGIGTPTLLLQGGESPHTYSLKPSQVKLLHEANLIIWIGPGLDKFLEKSLSALDNQIAVLRLFDVDNLNLLKVRESGDWEDSHHHQSNFDKSEPIEEFDQHLWLDPQNAQVIVKAIMAALSKIDPSQATRYQDNTNHLLGRLKQLDEELQILLAPIKKRPFLVFHDAYQYFEYRYGLKGVGVINLHPEQTPSAKHLSELRQRLKEQQVQCVFSEPQFEPALVTTLIENTVARRGILDPLGADLPAGTETYFVVLRQLAKSLRECLFSGN